MIICNTNFKWSKLNMFASTHVCKCSSIDVTIVFFSHSLYCVLCIHAMCCARVWIFFSFVTFIPFLGKIIFSLTFVAVWIVACAVPVLVRFDDAKINGLHCIWHLWLSIALPLSSVLSTSVSRSIALFVWIWNNYDVIVIYCWIVEYSNSIIYCWWIRKCRMSHEYEC